MDMQKHPQDGKTAKASDDQDHALSQEECLEEALDDSMDASDPPAATQPGDHGNPVPSSGFSEDDLNERDKAALRKH
ncbi:MAG TPA: hypothetical protein VF509_08735 [Sphingobium sp.]